MAGISVRDVRIIEIANPFQRSQSRREITVPPRPQESVYDCLLRVGIRAEDYVLLVNGQELIEGESPYYVAMPGTEIICAVAAGGGIGKILAMAALLAVTTALTGGLGDVVEAIAWSSMGIATAATAAAVATAISIGGSILISATMNGGGGSAKQASVTYDPTGPKTLAQAGSPIPKGYGTMGWGGSIIASFVDLDGKDEYLNVLVSFGWGLATGMSNILLNGKPIGTYPDLAYAMRLGTNEQTPIPGFDRIQNAYPQQIELLAANGPTVVTGTGLATTALQVAVKFPGGLMRTDSGGSPKECSIAYKIEISPSGANNWTAPIFPRDTTDVYTVDTNGFRHYPHWVVMPTDRYAGSGIVYSTDNDAGAHYPGESWSMNESVKVYNIDNSNYTYAQNFQGEWQLTADITLDLQSVTDWWGGYRIVSDMTNQSFYDVVNIYGLAAGKWDVRVTKYGAGPHNQPIPAGDGYMTDPHYTADAWLWVVTELQFTDLAYPNMVLLGIRALATTQINGADITVVANIAHALGEDTVLPPELASYEVDNPAVVAYDMITNPLYGLAATQPTTAPILVDVPAFARWASFNDEPVMGSSGVNARRHIFAGVFDQGGSNAWSCLQQVALMSRAQITQEGFLYSVWMDTPTDITQVFTEANIKQGSYTETYIDFDSRATEIEVEFADAARSWRTDLPVSVQSAATLNSGLQPKITRTNLLGCTSRDQAWKWAYFHLLTTSSILRSAQWECGIEAASCKRGSVVGVQQRQWALGGRVQAGSTTTALVIDRTDLQPFTLNQGWTVGVSHPIVLVGNLTIASAVSAGAGIILVSFNSTIPPSRVLRMVGAGGAEAAVLGITQTNGVNGQSLTARISTGSFTAGQVVSLYDYDRVELQLVQAVVGTQLTVPGFSQAPTPDAAWFYGQTGGTAPYELFRVTAIKQSGDNSYQISAIDYVLAPYEDEVPQLGELVTAPVINATVTGLTVVEQWQNSGVRGFAARYLQSTVVVSWSAGTNTAGADVYGSVDGGPMTRMDRVYAKGYSFPATLFDIWVIKVVGFDRLGVSASYADAPQASVTVLGPGNCPQDVPGFTGILTLNGSIFGAALSWAAAVGAATYELRYNTDPKNALWDTGTVLVTGTTAFSYFDPGQKPGLYMIRAITSAKVLSQNASTFSFALSSSSLDGQGSIIPLQQVAFTVVLGDNSKSNLPNQWTADVGVVAQSLIRADGSQVAVLAADVAVFPLADTTTYYIYLRVLCSTGLFQVGLADGSWCSSAAGSAVYATAILPTSPSPVLAAQAYADGYYPMDSAQITTGAAGYSGPIHTPPANPCPHGDELVILCGRKRVKVERVQPGDWLLGYSFADGTDCYRQVLSVEVAQAETWHLVDSYRVSPQHPVQRCEAGVPSGEWIAPFESGPYQRVLGNRVRLVLDENGYDEQNYYLVGRGEPLLMHNGSINPC